MKQMLLAALCTYACGDGGSEAPPPSSADAGTTTDAGTDGTSAGSRCTSSGTTLSCTSNAVQLGGRTVTYEVPLGTPPAAGWPVVVYYQGSFVPGSRAFTASTADSLGQYELTRTVKALLDGGYAVIAPNARGDGSQYWQTNVPPYATQWAGCEDDVFVKQLLDAMAGPMLGPLDASRRYAMGISSGGFMTSRMAVSYAGTFRALAIASASYATCSNTCNVPALPADHPPTLFLHGETDPLVPVSTMEPYRDALVAAGHDASTVVIAGAGHEWLADAVTAIPAWFDTH
jgi:poly(3-hydroxybutyrate) depolymerase